MIRQAEPEDLPAVLALLTEAKLPTAGVAEHLNSYFVFDEGGSIVGSAGLELHGAAVLLRSLAVAAAARGAGLGAALLRRALHEAHGRRDGVYALTTTAEAYLSRFGFERVPRSSLPSPLFESRELRDACPSSATVMKWVAATR
jgi:N-acetylglutamate synthase-like GNAT family acetyltransferase